jgi:FixJ family two-component response regulator
MTEKGTVYVVDDDAAVRDALVLLLTLYGYSVRAFSGGQSFLDSVDSRTRGCAIVDLRMPDCDGLMVLNELKQRQVSSLPVIMLTAYGDIATARLALRGGAVDFLEKPVNEPQLTASLTEQFDLQKSQAAPLAQHSEAKLAWERLTPRERDIMNRLLDGGTAREIASVLGISTRTVETHRAHILEKFEVNRMPDLLRIWLKHSGQR